MRKTSRWFLMMLMILCMFSLVSCQKEQSEQVSKVVYRLGKQDITLGEFSIYAKTIEEEYRKTYGSGIWGLELSTDDGSKTVLDITLEDLIADINRVKVLVAQAEDLNLALGDNEKAEAESVATEFYAGLTESDIANTEITKELVVTVIEENMLAQKVYNQIISEYDFEISEEEARMTTFYDIVFECYHLKDDGTVEEFTDEKKATQLEKASEALASLAQDEDVSYTDIVDKYNLQYSASYTMGKADLIQEYGESVAEHILELEDGAVSTVIESQYGYHIFKMIKANDEDLTKKNKESIIEQQQKDYFANIYEGWFKKYDSKFSMENVDMEMIRSISFSE